MTDKAEGWYGVELISWASVDYEYNLLVYSDVSPIHFWDGSTPLSHGMDNGYIAPDGSRSQKNWQQAPTPPPSSSSDSCQDTDNGRKD